MPELVEQSMQDFEETTTMISTNQKQEKHTNKQEKHTNKQEKHTDVSYCIMADLPKG